MQGVGVPLRNQQHAFFFSGMLLISSLLLACHEKESSCYEVMNLCMNLVYLFFLFTGGSYSCFERGLPFFLNL